MDDRKWLGEPNPASQSARALWLARDEHAQLSARARELAARDADRAAALEALAVERAIPAAARFARAAFALLTALHRSDSLDAQTYPALQRALEPPLRAAFERVEPPPLDADATSAADAATRAEAQRRVADALRGGEQSDADDDDDGDDDGGAHAGILVARALRRGALDAQ